MRRLIPLLLASACGGGGSVRVDLPLEEEHRALILAVEDGPDLDVYAFDLEDDRQPILQTLLPSYIGSYEVRLTAFLYQKPLANLGIEPGTMIEATADPRRPIPIATSTMTMAIRGAEIDDWAAVEQAGDPVRAFRIPDVEDEECILRGGCFERASNECLLPCPPVREPDPSDPPDLPSVVCPAGWEDVEVKPGISACTPWIGDAPACPDYQTIFPGEASCHSLGPGCPPAGMFPTEAPAGTRIYVRAGATGGDGTEGAPLGTIQAAFMQATGSEIIVIAGGTYRESLYLTQRVTLFGACPEQTIIDGPGQYAITSGASNVSVQNLRITADDDGIEVDGGASIQLVNVVIEGTGGQGVILVNESQADLQNVLIRNTGDTGIWIQGRASLTANRLHIFNGRGGVGADNATMTLTDAIIRDSRPNSDGSFGRGANIQNGAVAIFRNTIFDNSHDLGVFVSTAEAELDHAVVRRTKSSPKDNSGGQGILIQNDAEARILGSWIDDNRDSNVYTINTPVVTFEDTVISNAKVALNGGGGFNMQLLGRTSATLRRVAVTDAAYTSINVGSADSASLEDVTVLGAGIHPDSRVSGDGIHIEGQVHVNASRVRVEDAAAQAIDIVGEATSASLSDVTLARAGTGDCVFCSGLCLRNGAVVDQAIRIDIRDMRGTGVYCQDQDTRLVISHVVVDGTDRSATCVLNHNVRDVGRGVGLYAADGGIIDASYFVFSNSSESGAEVAQFLITSMNTALDLFYGTIRDNPIGTTVLIEGYDTRRVANNVVYTNNETNLNYGQ